MFGRIARVLMVVPTIAAQPLLDRLVRHVLNRRRNLPERLEESRHRLFLIDPLDLPFSLLVRFDHERPLLRAVPPGEAPTADAAVRGRFLALVDLVDGALDGDALFFSRELVVEGDTEAVVRLRNALDDTDGPLMEDVAGFFGPPGLKILATLQRWRRRPVETA